MVTRRPVVVGALYILLWEGSIATFAASADRFSIAAYGRALAVEGVVDVNAPDASALTALLVLAGGDRGGDLGRHAALQSNRASVTASSGHATHASRPSSLAR